MTRGAEMRVLHTSDLHLGKQFHERSLEQVHDQFFEWLLDQVDQYEIDAVLIAGDVYDVAMPPSYARRQLYRFTDAASRRGATTVVIAGNHDSPSTIAEAACLLERAGTKVIPEILEVPDDQVIVLNTRDGRPGAVVCGVPFIRPRQVAVSIAGQTQEDRQRAVSEGIADHYAQIYKAALARRSTLGMELPIIATGHLATVGTSRSEAMHEIYVGLLNAFPTDRLPPADYVALGHIHRPMKVGGHEHIRYCGSPIPLATDELAFDKQVLLVDFESGRLSKVTALPVPQFQPMRRITCGLEEIAEKLAEAADGHTEALPLWAEVIIASGGYASDLLVRVRECASSLPVEIVRVQRLAVDPVSGAIEPQGRTLDEMTPREVFEQLLVSRADIVPERLEKLRSLFEQVEADTLASDVA